MDKIINGFMDISTIEYVEQGKVPVTRTVIINVAEISSFHGYYLILKNGMKIPIDDEKSRQKIVRFLRSNSVDVEEK